LRASTNTTNNKFAPYLEQMSPMIDDAISKLGNVKFRSDPIGGTKYSRATSIISSAYKRHGQLLGYAILERLKDCERLQVWKEDSFKLSTESLQEARTHELMEKCLSLRLPYGEVESKIPMDIIVFDKSNRTLRSYNVKRGNGSYDAGKRKQITRELLRTNMLLLDYGREMGVKAVKAEAKIIFYYGLMSVPEPLSMSGRDLDEHFQFSVYDAVEAVNEYFKNGLYRLIESG
jgi:hypothetical protein